MAEYKKDSVNDIFSRINTLNDISEASKKEDEALLEKRITRMTPTANGFEVVKDNYIAKSTMEMKYSYNDIMVKPAVISTIEHRAECNPYDEDGNLPLFTAPMDTVVNIDNFNLFQEHGIIPILPRTCKEDDRIEFSRCGKWAAFSLQEFEKWFLGKCTPKDEKTPLRALIDIANGHISKLYELVRASKRVYGDSIKIMVGNIANPDTYRICVESRVDYVRCSIGTGAGCLSSSNVAIHYPIASLISEIAAIKNELIGRGADKDMLTKIIADGGIRNYSDVIKSLALGADYVMVGSVFAKMLESAAPKNANSDEWYSLPITTRLGDLTDFTLGKGGWKAKYDGKEIFLGDISATFYGMASRAGQIAMKGKKVHTSEGIERILPVTYTIGSWVENMVDYLRSAMSYTNSRTLDDFRNSDVVLVSRNTCDSVNK